MASEFVGRFEIEDSVPIEFLGDLVVLLKRIERLIPDWCAECFVSYSHTLGDAAAEINSRYDYRRASLSLSPRFFAEKNRKLGVLVHELCHITQEPLWNAIGDVRIRLTELDPANEKFVQELCRHAREQSVCDMAALVLRVLESTSSSSTVHGLVGSLPLD